MHICQVKETSCQLRILQPQVSQSFVACRETSGAGDLLPLLEEEAEEGYVLDVDLPSTSAPAPDPTCRLRDPFMIPGGNRGIERNSSSDMLRLEGAQRL